MGTVQDKTVWLLSAVGVLALMPSLLSTCFAGTDAEVDSELLINPLSSCLAPNMQTMKICLFTSAAPGRQRGHEKKFKQAAPHQHLYFPA